MRRFFVIPFTMLVFHGAASADKGKAHFLLKTAEHAFDEAGCFRGDRGTTGCEGESVFATGMAKVEQALAEDTSGETLRRVCLIASEAQGPDFTWEKEHGWDRRGIAVCELVGLAQDLPDSQRGAGPAGASNIRTRLFQARNEAENDAHMLAAAHALYGVGLKMKLDKAKNQISLDFGETNDLALQGFIAEYYLRYSRELRVGGELTGADATALTKEGTFGWVLLEPRAKLDLCMKIAYYMPKSRSETENWCGMQALIEAGSPVFAFRGKPVSYDGKAAGGGLAPTDRAWAPSADGRFDTAITVAGPTPIDDQAHVELVVRYGREMVRDDSKYHADALALIARAQRVYDGKRDQAHKNQDKIAGAGGKVLFAEGSFDRWEAPKVLGERDKPACENLSYAAFKRTANKGETLLLGMEVDGKHCWAANIDREFGLLMAPGSNKYGDNHCREALQIPGDHAVAMTLHTYKVFKTGRKEITDRGVIQDQYGSDIDKKLGTWKASCTTKGGGKVESRYE